MRPRSASASGEVWLTMRVTRCPPAECPVSMTGPATSRIAAVTAVPISRVISECAHPDTACRMASRPRTRAPPPRSPDATSSSCRAPSNSRRARTRRGLAAHPRAGTDRIGCARPPHTRCRAARALRGHCLTERLCRLYPGRRPPLPARNVRPVRVGIVPILDGIEHACTSRLQTQSAVPLQYRLRTSRHPRPCVHQCLHFVMPRRRAPQCDPAPTPATPARGSRHPRERGNGEPSSQRCPHRPQLRKQHHLQHAP